MQESIEGPSIALPTYLPFRSGLWFRCLKVLLVFIHN